MTYTNVYDIILNFSQFCIDFYTSQGYKVAIYICWLILGLGYVNRIRGES